jgi:hypothetical protein
MPVISATWEVEIRVSWFKANLGKKLRRPPPASQQTSQMWYMPEIPATREAFIGGLQSKAGTGKKHENV